MELWLRSPSILQVCTLHIVGSLLLIVVFHREFDALFLHTFACLLVCCITHSRGEALGRQLTGPGLEGTGVPAYRHLLFSRYRAGQFWGVPVREIACSRTYLFSAVLEGFWLLLVHSLDAGSYSTWKSKDDIPRPYLHYQHLQETQPTGSQYLQNTFIRVGYTCCSASIVVWKLCDCVTCMHPLYHARYPLPQ
jgi:hypothetical protein